MPNVEVVYPIITAVSLIVNLILLMVWGNLERRITALEQQ